ncbi:MAG: VWA domain-containing protein, partial [Phycisphaerales bacterium]|nr:VWA domain-containing protein [Phycisphaerales bacterium]
MANTLLLQTLPFVHPGLAWAALATGLIPILVHLINRRRYRRVPWAAMSFLLAANRRSAKRMRIEQLLLMAVRILVMLLAGLAVARPYLPDSRLAGLGSSRVHRILLLDNSLSMQAKRPDGLTRFDAAGTAANRLIASFPPTDGISMVTLADPSQAVIAHAAYDRRFVKDQVAAMRPTQRGTDVVGALNAALRIVRESDAPVGNRVVYVISDFPVSLWQSDSPQSPTAAARKAAELADALGNPATNLHFVRVDPGTGDNVAVTGVSPETPLIGLNVPARFAIEVTNFGPTSVRGLTLQARLDGPIVRRVSLPKLAPGETTRASVSTEFSAPGTKVIEARLSTSTEDTLAADDVRHLSIEVRESTPVLLVDGRPGSRLLEGQAGYLATALAPRAEAAALHPTPASFGRRRATLVEPKIISEPELGGEVLSHYDVVALCNVPHLSYEKWVDLESFVSAGGGLLVCLGDLVSADNYNRFGFAGGKGLLPGRIGRPPESLAHAAERLGIKLDARPHPIFADFAGHPTSGLFLARVDRYLPISLDPQRGEVILRYTNDAPAMLSASFGSGRVMVWTTTADMEWNNLPGKGDYVAVMLGVVASLAPGHGEHRNLTVGDTLREPLSPAESSMTLRMTAGSSPASEPSVVPLAASPRVGDAEQPLAPPTRGPTSALLAAEFGPLETAQVLTLSIGGSTRFFAVNTDRGESDLRAADGAALVAAAGRSINLMTEDEGAEASVAGRSTELSSMLFLVLLALLLGEPWLARWFGIPHPGGH